MAGMTNLRVPGRRDNSVVRQRRLIRRAVVDSFIPHKWSPITGLPGDWARSLVNPQTAALVQVWHEQAGELREKDLYKEFLAKLQRQWAIETGVLEGLYTISEGATTALIEKGLDAALISHEDTPDPPEQVFARIQDQHHAIMGVYQFVSGDRPLGTSYIKELHQVLTAHQDTYVGRDVLGNLVTRDLPKGEWKKLPNSVEHPDGTKFEYCPPEHVAQEVDNLITLHVEHEAANVPPDLEAAWLHHRFSLIHPFTDGNGRVARCLATLVLLRANWLPLVITRRDRANYIAALRSADQNDLRPLGDFFGMLQRKAIREALSLGEEVIHEATKIGGILAAVKEKFSKRRADQSALIKRAINTADSLHVLAKQRLEEVADEVHEVISAEAENYKACMRDAPRDTPTAKYYYHQIVQCAKALGYFANLPFYQAWAAICIRTDHQTEILFSFHGIGQETSGVLGCAAMLFTRERVRKGETIVGEPRPLTDSPFEFTYLEESADVQQRFRRWLDKCVLVGLEEWRKTV